MIYRKLLIWLILFWGINLGFAQSNSKVLKEGIQKAGNVTLGYGYPGNVSNGPVHGFMTFTSSQFESFEDNHRQVIFSSDWKTKHSIYLSTAYFISNRVSVSVSAKYWEYTQQWDTNGVRFKGGFQKIAFPLGIRYDIIRKNKWNLRLGFGVEISHQKFINSGYYKGHSAWDQLASIFNGQYLDDGDILVSNEYHFIHSPGDIVYGEIAGSLKISQKWSADMALRTGTIDGSNLFQLGVVYTVCNLPHISFHKRHH